MLCSDVDCGAMSAGCRYPKPRPRDSVRPRAQHKGDVNVRDLAEGKEYGSAKRRSSSSDSLQRNVHDTHRLRCIFRRLALWAAASESTAIASVTQHWTQPRTSHR